MAITLDTFRMIAATDMGDSKTVHIGDAAKTTLASTRYAGDRPLASREIAVLETAQDNIYIRSQLLSSLRDALGGEDNDYFRTVQERLFGIRGDAGQADMALASKPLTQREVREVLTGLDDIQISQRTRTAFDQAFTQAFTTAKGGKQISTRAQEVIRQIVLPSVEARLAANPRITLAELTGPDTTFGLLQDLIAHQANPMRRLIAASTLHEPATRAFLQACKLIVADMPNGLDHRLLAVADKLSTLKERDFTPAKIFKLACPDVRWPAEIPTSTLELSQTERYTLTTALMGDVLENVKREFAEATDPVAQARASTRFSACALMFDLGMKSEDVARVLADPTSFRGEMVPRGGYVVGEMDIERGLDIAFGQFCADLDRIQAKVFVNAPGSGMWMAPAATRVTNHPARQLALNELRTKIESLCGPGASEAMKTNVFLAMTQNAQPTDGILTSLLDGKAVGNQLYTFSLLRNDDGSVTVRRSMEAPSRSAVNMAVRIHPDGTQELQEAPKAVFRLDLTTAQVQTAQTADLQKAQAEADLYLRDHLLNKYGGDFADLCGSDIDAVKAEFPTAVQSHGHFRQTAINQFSRYLSAHRDVAVRLESLSPEARQAELQTIKAAVLPRAKAMMYRDVFDETCKAQAQAALKQAAGTLDGKPLDFTNVKPFVGRIHEKISYLDFDDDHLSLSDVKTACERIRDEFIADRIAVFDEIKRLSGDEAPLREALLRNALEHPHLDLEGLRTALDIARSLPLTSRDVYLDGPRVKEMFHTFGQAMARASAKLDEKKFGAEQKGNLTTVVALYTQIVHRSELLNAFAVLKSGELGDILADLKPDHEHSRFFVGDTPEYREYMARTFVQNIIGGIADEFGLR